MLRGIRMIEWPANLQRMDKALPVSFHRRKERPRGQYGPRGGKGGGRLRARAGMQDVACELYDGRHEILNEKDRQLVDDERSCVLMSGIWTDLTKIVTFL